MASEGGLPTLSGFPEVPGFTIGGIEVSDGDFSEAFTTNDQKRMSISEKEFVFI
jgi:hypothetical protein